jgi:uncharacterized protein YndB with AHSA1/START domain
MRKTFLFSVLVAGLLSSCYSHRKAMEAGKPYTEQIRWPQAYQPQQTTFYVHNRIDIHASPERVWNILVAAETWPLWYKGAADVKVLQPDTGILTADAQFTWKTMGLQFTSTVKEFVPYERLSWESRKNSIQGYHAWLIIPTDTGCTLVTDESQLGWLTLLEKTFQPRKLHRLHGIWLEEIKKKAEAAQVSVHSKN